LTVFVDTSALYAALDADDANHTKAVEAFRDLAPREPLVTHSYVLVESGALVQRRLGMEAVRALFDDLSALVEVVWVDEPLHRSALAAMIATGHQDVSLVDWTSFEVMRERGIGRALAFDDHFATQGFELAGS
jgi:predicted nucleic acid-binding protein